MVRTNIDSIAQCCVNFIKVVHKIVILYIWCDASGHGTYNTWISSGLPSVDILSQKYFSDHNKTFVYFVYFSCFMYDSC